MKFSIIQGWEKYFLPTRKSWSEDRDENRERKSRSAHFPSLISASSIPFFPTTKLFNFCFSFRE